MAHVVEVRCEKNPHRLFTKLRMENPPSIVEGNLIEFSCRDCAKDLGVERVLHRFDLSGELVETELLQQVK